MHRWPHGAAALQARVERFTAAFREVAGGEEQAAQLLEFVGLDTERGMGVWGSYRTSSSDAACARGRWRAITADPRWPAAFAELRSYGFRMDDADPDGLQHAVDDVASLSNATIMQSRQVWNAYLNRRMAQYYRASVFQPLRAALPRVHVSNYGQTLKGRSPCIPDGAGFVDCALRNASELWAITGDVQAPGGYDSFEQRSLVYNVKE